MSIYKKITFFILFSSISFSLCAQLLDKTLATVRLTDTEVVSANELSDQFAILESQLNTVLTAEQKEEVFQSKINSILINQSARRTDLFITETEIQNAIQRQKATLSTVLSDADYRRLIFEQTGISWESYRSQVEDRLLQEKYIVYAKPELLQNILQPSEKEIETVYEQNAQSFVSPAMSRFSHIFIETRESPDTERNQAHRRMTSYLTRIRNGGEAEFEEIITETLDDAAVSGGDFGYILSGEPNTIQVLGEDFVSALLDMKTGDISDIMESNIGFHIVLITDRRSPRLLNLNDPLLPGQSLTVYQQIVQYILNQKQQEALIQALKEITTELRSEAEIRIFEENIPW